jgi:hypothetical protein
MKNADPHCQFYESLIVFFFFFSCHRLVPLAHSDSELILRLYESFAYLAGVFRTGDWPIARTLPTPHNTNKHGYAWVSRAVFELKIQEFEPYALRF